MLQYLLSVDLNPHFAEDRGMIDRRTLVKTATASLLAAPSILRAQSVKSAIIVGAGSAGLTAAYHLTQQGVNVRVLEASDQWGGRVRRDASLSNVPIDLGAEWIHDDPTILGQMIGQGETDLGVDTIEYNPQTFKFWHKGKLRNLNMLKHAYAEVKFYDTTWYGFFERFVLPTVADRIEYNSVVNGVSVSPNGVTVDLTDGRRMQADRVLITVPLSILKKQRIKFSNAPDSARLSDLDDVVFGKGFKVFMKFSERFYPDILLFGSRLSVLADEWDSKIYYDAAFGKPTDDNLLGLFTVNETHLPRASLSNKALLEDALSELTDIFGAVVHQSFQSGTVQNWSQEPHILGSYSMTNDSDEYLADILAPISGRIHFAGEALGGDAQSTVHGAAFSAIGAVQAMVSG